MTLIPYFILSPPSTPFDSDSDLSDMFAKLFVLFAIAHVALSAPAAALDATLKRSGMSSTPSCCWSLYRPDYVPDDLVSGFRRDVPDS